jgi:hypothetical protein
MPRLVVTREASLTRWGSGRSPRTVGVVEGAHAAEGMNWTNMPLNLFSVTRVVSKRLRRATVPEMPSS